MGTEIAVPASEPSIGRGNAALNDLTVTLTTPHKSPLPDTGLGLKHPIHSSPRN